MHFFKSIIFNLKKSLPIGLKWKLRKIWYYGNTHYCNVCKSNISHFISGGTDLPAIIKYEIISSGYHEFDYCPVCRAGYRQRLVKLYVDEKNLLTPDLSILHIAPEEPLYEVLRKSSKNYICADLMPDRYSYYANPVYMDLTKISFPNNTFDLVLCSHVLEHIPDDALAMSELHRVLKNTGTAIIQVPISKKLNKTYEDFSVQTDEERLEKFGQHDHVRIYSTDIVNRLATAGFEVETVSSASFATVKNFDKLMLDLKEDLFICSKD